MLTRLVKRQLILFGVITVIALTTLGWYYLRLPTLAGIGVYELKADLPASGGLYSTANVTYRGITIGKVTDVQPTEQGAQATMHIDNRYRIPVDATANVHSVSAAGEQYLDLVSPESPGRYLSPGQTITKGTVPREIGPALDAANRGLAALPADKIPQLLTETAQSVGGLGPALQRLVDATQALASGTVTHAENFRDIIQNAGPILDSQVKSGDAIERWARNLNSLAGQAAETDPNIKNILRQGAPTADELNAVFSDVRETLPQTLANTAIVTDMVRRYNRPNFEQMLVFLPELGSLLQTITSTFPDRAGLNIPAGLISHPPPCLTGYIPASQWRAYADTSEMDLPEVYCKIPQDTPNNSVRGVRNIPCVDVPGKRAPTPKDCRSDKPYIPLGTNPWYGDPNQIRNCPAPGARCDQPVDPGRVIQAPSVNTGMNPLPADLLPGTPPPRNDPLSRPGSGNVQCNGQQPNPCVYTPHGPAAIYSPYSAEVLGPDGTLFSLDDSNKPGDAGWKDMLAPAS